MFLRFNRRFKDGKEHRYWNIVESKRCAGGRVVQRQVLYLGEINDSQLSACAVELPATVMMTSRPSERISSLPELLNSRDGIVSYQD
jgi:hypothetical protein